MTDEIAGERSWYPARDNPPHLTLKKRQGTRSVAEIRRGSPFIAAGSKAIAEARREAALGLLLLWHDHWPESHAIAQAHEGEVDFDLLHAIGHRREGDYANAVYWLGEAENHPLLRRKILPGEGWDPKGFVKAVEENPDDPRLRGVQAGEFLVFFGYLLGA